ncbi:transcriptional regulator GutM [Erwinia persicina]|uniref:Transcriptional regulator GutM n=1 Tax=Erwinia persicina TaxID=55211 RepID=A0A4V6X8Q2_9GAMM|nr:transcriptional regulator GutM [Erwinia persicina]MBD8107467.1 transcriptional regulator GutM [Erwinia persicina]MBD8166222.1 transcriptional regulator GutM [Erwinia persicina]MBD8210621.1 transcriptional regulator GutM [Erwinia persicina]MCQ4092855.1 transcriptional regulator GutM [Erwinia persicina]MCQ4100538.1 transcriptional regulator GutM [Erwinia persicina]
MSSVNMFICVAGFAWLGQIALGWLQMSRFNHALTQLPSEGRIGIGRSSGRFKPRAVLVICVDSRHIITGNFVMRGLTVFSQPIPDDALNGLNIQNLVPAHIYPHNKAMRTALELAITNKR